MKSPVSSMPAYAAHDAATLRFYADGAATYAANARRSASLRLEGFLERLTPGARILELGCGDGRDSEAMLARGFDVDATDGVAAIARLAEARIGRPVRVMTFEALQAVEAYDGVWAQASLLHAPRPALPDILSRVFRALKPGGFHVASFKAGGAEGRDPLGRYFNYPSVEDLAALYREAADWDVEPIIEYVGGDYGGGERPWLAVTARRPL